MRLKRVVLNNIGLKLIALFLAVITWVYIVGELNKVAPEERASLERLLPYRMTAKFLPVQINLIGESREGYTVIKDKVIADPHGIMVIGPRSLLGRLGFVKTEPIDISAYTKPLTKDVSLMPLARGLSVKEKFVTVTIPIQKK